MIAILVLALVNLAAPAYVPGGSPVPKPLLRQPAEHVWRDAPYDLGCRDEVAAYLEAVLEARCEEALPDLIAHMDYMPTGPDIDHPSPTEIRNPVYPVVKSFGPSAIEPLIAAIRRGEFSGLYGGCKDWLFLECLVAIYDETGCSATARLKLEAERGSPAEKKIFLRLLSAPQIIGWDRYWKERESK